MYTLPLLWYIMKLCAFLFTKHTISLCTKTMKTRIKMFSNKNHASRVGKKVLKQDDYHQTSQLTTQCTYTTLLHFEYYATVMHFSHKLLKTRTLYKVLNMEVCIYAYTKFSLNRERICF